MATDAKETYLLDHRWLEDGVLLAPPARGPLTHLTLFVCTYVARLQNLHMNFVALTRDLCANPHGCLLAVNSNFGHAAQPGYERYLKTPKPAPARPVPARNRARKMQGDGTCFNSAVEPIVAVEHPGVPVGKVYKVKCFSSTGETQVPGVTCADLSDGDAVLEAFTAYLNELGVGDFEDPAAAPAPAPAPEGTAPEPAPAPGDSTQDPAPRDPAPASATEPAARDLTLEGPAPAPAAGNSAPAPEPAPGDPVGPSPAPLRRPVVYAGGRPTMINYKFRVVRNSPRILVNLYNLAAYLLHLEGTKAVEGPPLSAGQAARFEGWPAVLLPPYPVRETKLPTDDVKVSFRFAGAGRAPRVNVFQEGKINILGADSEETAEQIYGYLTRLFAANWALLVCLRPRRDAERRQLAQAPRPARLALTPAPRPTPPLSDAELDAVLVDVLGYNPCHAPPEAAAAPPGEKEEAGASSMLSSVDEAIVGEIVDDLADWGFEEDDELPGDGDSGDEAEGPARFDVRLAAARSAPRALELPGDGDSDDEAEGPARFDVRLAAARSALRALEHPVLDEVEGDYVEED